MRCYFMRAGHIAAVEFLQHGSDENLIKQGKILFNERANGLYDGFDVWDGKRRLHVYPALEADERPQRGLSNGVAGPGSS